MVYARIVTYLICISIEISMNGWNATISMKFGMKFLIKLFVLWMNKIMVWTNFTTHAIGHMDKTWWWISYVFLSHSIYQIDNTDAFDHVGEMSHKDDIDNMDQLKK
jgi:hypothetical protein